MLWQLDKFRSSIYVEYWKLAYSWTIIILGSKNYVDSNDSVLKIAPNENKLKLYVIYALKLKSNFEHKKTLRCRNKIYGV